MRGFITFALPFELNPQTGSAYIGDDCKFEIRLRSEILTKALSSDRTITLRNNVKKRVFSTGKLVLGSSVSPSDMKHVQ